MWRLLLCAVVSHVIHVIAATEDGQKSEGSRLVHTPQGPVLGHRAPEGDLFIYYSIPYAKSPTGIHRFKAPLPGPIWFETLEAVDKGIVCPQTDYMNITTGKSVQEDCLIANIYVPDTDETNLPVVIYVHGGAYQVGYGDIFTPKNLVRSKKVIAVTFNYRLGIHGFLCLGTKDAPGNAGMKDQVALLRWVNRNIASFGGNPDDVTIDGYSAGASAVDLLQLSATTKGLFNKVIVESGANVALWSVQLDPLENAKNYARTVDFTNVDDIYALTEFYTTASFEVLTLDTFMDRPDSSFVFSPCVERDTGTGVKRFLEDTPVNILKEGKYNKVRMLYGISNMEGISRVHIYFDQFKDRMNEQFSDFLPADLQFDSKEEKENVAKVVKKFYFGDKAVGEETILSYINYFTDITFAYPTLRSVKLQVEAGNDKIYLYEYSFAESETPLVGDIKVRGASHCAQTGIILDEMGIENEDDSTASDKFKKFRSVMRQLWLNFITAGEPVPARSPLPEWPPVRANSAPHMSLGEPLHLRGPLLQHRALFWDRIYERHYRMPVPPPSPPPPPHSEL